MNPSHLKDLQPDPQNRRKHTPRNLGMLVDALHKVGAARSIVIDEAGQVLAGNGVVEAAAEAGITKVQVVEADGSTVIAVRRRGLSEAQKRELAIYDNRVAELAEWDPDQLRADQVAGLDLQPFFTEQELAALLGEQPKAGRTDPDAVPAERPTSIQAGDLFELGAHRLLCGDCTVQADVARLMGDVTVNAVVTDPPYGIGFHYASYEDTREAWFRLMDTIVPQLQALAPFVVMPCGGIDRLGWWFNHHAPDWVLCWYKGSPGHRSHVGFNDWEPHLVWGKPPSQIHDYWQTECGFEVEGHPCPKTIAYANWLIERAAQSAGVVFDGFVGAGTTIIACEQLRRRCLAIEIDPSYCQVSIDRWEAFTGQQAQKVGELVRA